MRRYISGLVAGSVFLAGGALVHAGGFETPENGTVANGRGGAFTARASDATALMLNVAGIGTGGADQGHWQIWAGANLSVFSSCFQRAGTYDSLGGGIDRSGTIFDDPASGTPSHDYTGRAYPSACNNAPPFVAPQVLATYAVNRRLAFGFGVYGPNSVGQISYPDRVTTTDAMGHNPLPAPAPQRYALLNENLLIIFPTLAVSYEVVPGVLRLGAAVQPSIAHLEFETMANSGGGQSPANDLMTHVGATGFFMAGNLGALFTPTSFLEIGAHAHLSQNIDASGSGNAVSNFYANISAMPPAHQVLTDHFDVPSMKVGQPNQVRLGLRFIVPRNGQPAVNDPHSSRPHDPMRDEIADIEVDGIYEGSSAFDNLTLQFNGRVNITDHLSNPLPTPINIPHHWNDAWGLRVGGDVNVIPDHLALRAGFSYETGAAPPQFQNFDVPGMSTLGLHVGGTVRLGRHVAISLAYAHQFVATVDNTADIHGPNNPGIATIGTMGVLTASQCYSGSLVGAGGCQNNQGVFTSSLDVLSVGANFAF